MNQLLPLLPLLLTIAAVAGILAALHLLLIARKPHLGAERLFPRQLLLLAATLVGLVTIVFALPVGSDTRNQVLGVLGLVFSGVFAFSSTTVVANLFAGLLLRITRPFQTGDFVRVGEAFGRVSERGLFDTEIQSEFRELIALPNAWLINHPVYTTHVSGTIVSAQLSLGYDVHHREIEGLLVQAAEKVGLAEPFVHVLELGDFAVSYRVSGLLSDVKWLMTARSDLNRSVLDTLHDAGVEIASPTIMVRRSLPEGTLLIPRPAAASTGGDSTLAEDVAFDKAERAHQREAEREALAAELARVQESLEAAEGDARAALKNRIAGLKEQLAALAEADTDSDDS